MDYCAKESTICGMEAPRVETSVKDQLEVIEKKLFETYLTLANIINGLNGVEKPEEESHEKKCMQESLFAIDALSDHCVSLSHRVHDLLF